MPHIAANKVYPEFDAAPLYCLEDEKRRRQTLTREAKEDEFREVREQYENLTEVRFARWIAAGNEEHHFPCDPM
jgi:hypothetical protein